MEAHRGFTFFYRSLTKGLDEDGIMKINALLGFPEAIAANEAARVRSASGADFEVG